MRQFVGYMPESDCLPPDTSRDRLRGPDGAAVRPARRRGPRADRRGPPPRRAVRGALPADRRLLDRHEAAGQARPGARPRSAAAAPRRADQRPRPGRPRRDARARPADRHGVRDRGHRRQPSARRDRAGLRLPRRHRCRSAGPRGAARRRSPSGPGCWPSRSRKARTASPRRSSRARHPGRRRRADRPRRRSTTSGRGTSSATPSPTLGLPLVRLEQRRHGLEELFR